MSASIACNDEPYVICQTCESEMTTEQLRCMRCCNASLPETCLSHEPTCIPEDVPIPLSARRKPITIKLVASAPPKQEKAPESSNPTPISEKRPDPVITKPRQTIWLDSPETPLNTLAEICSRNLPALLPQPDPLEYGFKNSLPVASFIGQSKIIGVADDDAIIEKLGADMIATQKIIAEKLAAEKLAAEKRGAKKLAAEKLAAEKLAAEKLAAEKLAAEKLAAEKLAAEKLAAEKLAAEKRAAAGRLAAEKRAAERAAAEKRAADMVAAENAAAENAAAENAAAENAAAEKRAVEKAAAEKRTAEKVDAIIDVSKQMWRDVILDFTKGFSSPGLQPKSSIQKWKDDCQNITDECKTRKTGTLVFYRTTFITIRDLAHSCLGLEWTNKCIDIVNYKNKDNLQRLHLSPLPKCIPVPVKISTRPVPRPDESPLASPTPKYKEQVHVDAIPVKIKTRKPVTQAAELPWATPGSSLLVFFTDKWLKATFVATVHSGYKFAFADNTECVVTNADVLWRVMTFEQFATVQPPADKKRKLEIMIAEKEEMELQHAALKKKVAVFELKMTEKKEMIAQLTAL